ncbi:MAG TPA: hypothetical protein VL362_03110 [Patescibacteria group bacterium]|jgi:hypothetical protein|nr:hypothetical protein [Patescibacteria group bacterium]
MSKEVTRLDADYDTDERIRDRIDAAALSRKTFIDAVGRLAPFLPELPDSQATHTYEQLQSYERFVAPTDHIDEYRDGSAVEADEILTLPRSGPLLLSADHATNPIRKATAQMGHADHGTAGLALLLGDEMQASVVLPQGRQSGNANVDLEHPLKTQLAVLLPAHQAFLSVHGMKPGKFVHPFDATEIHAVLGLGTDPSEYMLDTAHDIRRRLRTDYGLRVTVGGEEPFFDDPDMTGRLTYADDGSVIHAPRLAAAGEGSTTNFVRRHAQNADFPALQVELSRSLRLVPRELEYRDARQKIMAVYLGYLAVREISTIVTETSEI